MIVVVVEVVCCRKVRGFKFNYFEVFVLISDELLEGVCDGKMVVEFMSYGKIILNEEDVMDGVVNMIIEFEIEVIFLDGIKLIIVYYLIV